METRNGNGTEESPNSIYFLFSIFLFFVYQYVIIINLPTFLCVYDLFMCRGEIVTKIGSLHFGGSGGIPIKLGSSDTNH